MHGRESLGSSLRRGALAEGKEGHQWQPSIRAARAVKRQIRRGLSPPQWPADDAGTRYVPGLVLAETLPFSITRRMAGSAPNTGL
jgi:hypothetical protein